QNPTRPARAHTRSAPQTRARPQTRASAAHTTPGRRPLHHHNPEIHRLPPPAHHQPHPRLPLDGGPRPQQPLPPHPRRHPPPAAALAPGAIAPPSPPNRPPRNRLARIPHQPPHPPPPPPPPAEGALPSPPPPHPPPHTPQPPLGQELRLVLQEQAMGLTIHEA